MKRFLILALGIFLFSFCSVQKRRYLKGYYFEKENKRSTVISKFDSKPVNHFPTGISSSMLASKDNALEGVLMRKGITEDATDCGDTIIMKNGNRIICQVLELSPDEVSFKECDSEENVAQQLKKEEIISISYKNGTKEFIEKNNKRIKEIPKKQFKNQKFYISSDSTFYQGRQVFSDSKGKFIWKEVEVQGSENKLLDHKVSKPPFFNKSVKEAKKIALIIGVLFTLLKLIITATFIVSVIMAIVCFLTLCWLFI